MELIKRIKQAEAEAQRIVEEAKVQAAKSAEEGRGSRDELQAVAERERKEALEAAIAAAESEGAAEIEKLKGQAEKEQQRLREKAEGKMAGAVEKLMEYLRG